MITYMCYNAFSLKGGRNGKANAETRAGGEPR